jgi:hypothetical protein
MKEKSQIDEMRAAVRGDLERSRRRAESSPVVQPQERPQPEPAAEEAPRPGIFGSLFGRKS